MKYSFIIPAFNEEKYIAKCILSIQRGVNLPTTDYEIIVVCNNCTDKTGSIASRMGCIVINSSGDNIAKVRNDGARIACNNFLIFIDADSYVDWQLLAAIDNTCIAGGALVELDHISYVGEWIIKKWNNYCIRDKIFTGSFIFIEKALFYSIGMFDESMYILEDIGLSIKVNEYAGKYGHKTQLIKHCKIVTSDRKLRLYNIFEHLYFWFNIWWRLEKVITDRKYCKIWYDGRRESIC